MPVGATLGAGVLGAGATMFGASKAADAQKRTAEQANALMREQFNATRADAAPFVAGGAQSFNELGVRMPELMAPFTPGDLESTPGYQFTLQQALKAGQNAFAAKGLGSSGAAVKGAQDRAAGLASTTYQQAFDNYMKKNQAVYNMLMGRSQVGASAATSTGQIGAQMATATGNNLIGAGNAEAGAWMAGAGAFGNAFTGASNLYAQQQMLDMMLRRGTSESTLPPAGARGWGAP